MNNLVIAITGSTGAGKSSVSLAMAKKLDKCVFIEVDHIKHMIISGFYKKEDKWLYSEWKLVGETIGLMGNNFIKNGYNVIIGGYLDIEGWESLENNLNIKYRFLLTPSEEIIRIRDNERDSKDYMGEKAIQEHIDYFGNSDLFKVFTKIDSSEQTVDETVEAILDKIDSNST